MTIGLLCALNSKAEVASLITRNPFVSSHKEFVEPETILPKETSAELDAILEFCGSHTLGEKRKFSILTKEDGKRYWLELSQSVSGYKLIKYSELDRALLLERNEKLEILYVREKRKLAKPRLHIGHSNTLTPSLKKPFSNPQRDSYKGRRIIPRDARPPKLTPKEPEFRENIPSPPRKTVPVKA